MKWAEITGNQIDNSRGIYGQKAHKLSFFLEKKHYPLQASLETIEKSTLADEVL